MPSGMNKSNSARQIVIAMQLDSKATVIKQKGTKVVPYRGYEIKVHPALVEGHPNHCYIGFNGIGIAFRSGFAEAKLFVDQEKERTRDKSVRMIKRKTVKKVVPLDCPKCKGLGCLPSGRECTLCSGTGVKS